MQNKISLLSTVLLLAILFGLVSTCGTSLRFERGFKDGYKEAMAEHDFDENQAETKGISHLYEVCLWPKENVDYRDSLFNLRSETFLKTSVSNVDIQITERLDLKYGGVKITAEIIIILAALVWIYLFLCFIANIRSGDIYVKVNERYLCWMGAIFLAIYSLNWVCSLIDFYNLRSILDFENYRVAIQTPSTYSLAVGVGFLLISAIFSLGRNMKEDQEYMV